jgi:hypothetical protein
MITVRYDYGYDWWVLSDSNHDLDDEFAYTTDEVEQIVKTMLRKLRQLGYEAKVNWPKGWPPDDEEIEAATESE